MELFILTKSDGSPIADKTAAAVTSVTNSTVLDDIGNLVLDDSEPITLKFTTGTAAPAFSGDATYTPEITLGTVTSDGSCEYAAATSITAVTGGWTARIELTGASLESAINVLGGNSAPYTWPPTGPRGGWLTLQVRVTNPTGNIVTYALLPVFVEWRVTT